MLYSLMLVVHLTLAAATGVLAVAIVWYLANNREEKYATLAQLLGGIVAAEILTGTLLAIVSPTLTAAALSLHILMYLSACGVIEGVLLYKMRAHAFPVLNVAYPVCLSIFAFGLVVFLGF